MKENIEKEILFEVENSSYLSKAITYMMGGNNFIFNNFV